MNKLAISVIMLVHRNDERLRKALTSVSFANQIVIIDNQSGVDWAELQKNYPLEVRKLKEKIEDFSKVRNQALGYAKNEWVFFVDSDEEVVRGAEPQLVELLSLANVSFGVVYRSDIFLGKQQHYGEAGHQALVRLGKKTRLHFTGMVHEIAVANGNCHYTRIELLHHAHPSISEFIDDVSGYAQIVARAKTTDFGQNLFELICFPPVKLLYGLFIQGGILDGWRGVVYACCMSLHSLLVRIYRYEILANTAEPEKN